MASLRNDLNNRHAEKSDKALNDALKTMFDAQLRDELKSELQTKYGISGNKKNESKSNNSLMIKAESSKSGLFLRRAAIGIAASLVLFIASYFVIRSMQTDLFEQAEIFALAELPVHPGLTKGAETLENQMREAISFFNNQDWGRAEAYFAGIVPATSETIYYQALSAFMNKNYVVAIGLLNTEVVSRSIYDQEAAWYLGLSFILNDQVDEGLNILNKIQPGEWKYEEAQRLLNK